MLQQRQILTSKDPIEKAPVLVKTKYLYLSSQYRDNGDINGFEVNMPSSFFKTLRNQIIKISLANITVQKCWYETRTGISADYQNSFGTFSIPDGSYSGDTLVTILNSDASFSQDYTISYSYTTNKLTFTAKNGGSFLKPINCGYLLGLIDGTTYNGSFTSSHPINCTYEKTLYVNTNVGTSHSSLDNILDKVDYSTIIGTIPIPCAPFDIIQYTTNSFNNTSGLLIDSNQGIDSLKVWISTDKGNIPTLFEDWQISFKIEFFNA